MEVEQFLLLLGAPAYRIGFDQVCTAIEYVLAHPETTHITREIYPAVAEKYGTTTQCVDHNIRCIVEYVWLYGDQTMLRSLFVGRDDYRPGNKAFVFTVARHLSMTQKRDLANRRRLAAAQSAERPAQPRQEDAAPAPASGKRPPA